jgi:hypothetical protein
MPNRKTLVLSINSSREFDPKDHKDTDREFINIDYNKPIDAKLMTGVSDDAKSISSFILHAQHPRQKDPQKNPSIRMSNNSLISDEPAMVYLLVGPLYYLNNQLVTAALVIWNSLYEPDGKEPEGRGNGLWQVVPIVADTDTTAGTETITEIVEAMKRAGVGPEVRQVPDLDIEMNLNNFVSSNTPIFIGVTDRNHLQVFYGMDASIPILPETFYELATVMHKQLRSREQDYSGVEEVFKLVEKRVGGDQQYFNPKNLVDILYVKEGVNSGSMSGGKKVGSRKKNKRGGKKGSNDYDIQTSGNVYIDCKPVNIDEEEENVKMEGYKLKSNMDIIPSKQKIKKFFQNPWVQGFLLFLLILMLFYIVRMLMMKGKSASKAEMNGGKVKTKNS